MSNDNTEDVEVFDPTLYPLDITTLTKGQTFDPVHMGLVPPMKDLGIQRWQLKMMQLQHSLIDQAYSRKIPMSFRVYRGLIKVMTDAEAAEYHDRRASNHLHGIGMQSSHMRSLVDRSNLNQQQQETHARNTALWALRYQAARKPMRALESKTQKEHAKIEHDGIKHPNPFQK